ncbi:GGDEF domain-containing protein [Piscinibacter sp.]|jgi:diguanylate cyclase (GGDEF)-like protein|uniref:GGDEF domain-containing protein n=1 Tax=Piscinibacter sp. TaxID=1903157 RepID=UPI001B6D0740|nr:GGDEF domain-containing protein [Piscinibacter sp.]MBK7529490.1 diguanylate cyclase [Piscinibacter sp.]MBL0093166.1 diguanylate cyclase [Piscinibacter sp.]MBP6544383.1 diguanylate cyclase [Piscinibacter sp.]
MDPNTVIIMLATHLICSGGLYYLIGRGMPPRSGLRLWSAGGVLFGSAYIARMVAGRDIEAPWMLTADAAMVLAALFFVAGLRQFLGRAPGRWPWFAGAVLLYGALHLAAVQSGGLVGRHVLLNVTLGLIYAALATESLMARGAQGSALASPLLVLTLVMGTLSLLTGARGFFIAMHGIEVVYRGLYAQVYYSYASLAAVLLGLNLVWMVFVRLNTQLTELASRDALTRVLNRNGLDEVLSRHFAERTPRPVTLMQVDIDNFKRINDSHGHAAGDLVLREVAASLNASIRASDFIARVGGEEFLVGCVAADDGVARSLADRLLNGVRKLEVALPGVKIPVRCTVSIGISRRCNERADWELCWAEADRALYAAKAEGRDRVMAAGAMPPPLRDAAPLRSPAPG